ncbi:Protein of unknown function [Sphingomonas palmae]|uniref:DUF3429 domain-containing protein n=1 Tax=Sphingomonas palmae TaxID=1855283 RepID=A0A1H7LGE5_9SPHN|nr:DUF3429 domain-containing protein [Sphingomonas palmae]SEK97908.1 Protein of unknown function [Sphingomonas palmae]
MSEADGHAPIESAAFPVGRTAFALGFAGLLPQIAAALLAGLGYFSGGAIAVGYAALILSFLGGMWWGLAMFLRLGQGVVVTLAVVPSLVAGALAAFAFVHLPSALVALGSAILLTLPVDRWLTTRGLAPPNWMSLRIPLSVGLGSLTIIAGVLAA